MSLRPLIGLAFAACLAMTLSCAVADAPDSGPTAAYEPPPVPSPARMGLPPLYRAFYDVLEGEGDWALIEPYGWVFRPAVNFDAWRPYQQGWWEPSEAFGWIWNSTDPFGWVTDHYGAWFYDSYQGWVWQPGPVWGPAWVGWVGAGDYLGWAPLAPADYNDFANVPGDVFTFALASQFGTMQSNSQALFLSRPPVSRDRLTEISNPTRRDGVAFNRGPDFATFQRFGTAVAPRAEAPSIPRVKLPAVQPPAESELLLRTKRLVAIGMRQLEPAGDGTVTPPPASPPPAPQAKPGGKTAPPDSLPAKNPRPKGPKSAPPKAPPPPEPHGQPGAKPDSASG